MSEHGVAILMSTHTLEVAQEMCDRISIILKGKIIARGTVDELRALAGSAASSDQQLTEVFLRLTGGSGLPGDRRDRLDGRSRFPICCCRRSGRRATARGGASAAICMRGLIFGAIGCSCVAAHLLRGRSGSTWQLSTYAEFGDYLLRLGLSWLFLTFLSFLAFSGVVTALSTFFLSDDLRLLLAAPVAARRLCSTRGSRGRSVRRPGWSWCFSCRCCRRRARALRGRTFYLIAVADGACRSSSFRWRSGRPSRCCSSTCFRPGARATS